MIEGTVQSREAEATEKTTFTVKGEQLAKYVFKRSDEQGNYAPIAIGGMLSIMKMKDGKVRAAVFGRETDTLVGFVMEAGWEIETGDAFAVVELKSKEEQLQDSVR